MAYINFKNVTFSYPENPAMPALQDLSLQVEKGQFVVLCGHSGCGKSTLLRLLKQEIKPHGAILGDIQLEGQSLLVENSSSKGIGYVFQDPENQVVADEVLHELAFGLENVGLSTNEMRNRIAEMVNFMGAENLLHRKTHTLSGGQKQQLNLASVLLMQPNVLLLDEPTAQLDPVSAREFLDMIVRLNGEFGLTVIMAEHRLEEVLAVADKIVMMEKGQIRLEGRPKEILPKVWDSSEKPYVPTIPSFYLKVFDQGQEGCGVGASSEVPLTVKEGRSWLRERRDGSPVYGYESTESTQLISEHKLDKPELPPSEPIIEVKNLFFQYDARKPSEAILKGLSLNLHKGEFYTLLGGNGSGKSTLMKLICGVSKPQRGKVIINKRDLKRWGRQELAKMIGYLPQNPKLYFIQDTVGKELQDTLEQWGLATESGEKRTSDLLNSLGIPHLTNKHPYDLSGGEIQKVALACLLVRQPQILLLDEPTKGLDPVSKGQLADILLELQSQGLTIMMTSHDVEFAAKYADRCGMMFEGRITSESSPASFFKGNFFYTTMIQRLFRGYTEDVVTMEEAIRIWGAR
ncbi:MULTISPECIES: ABC transporter ATP-binding protein [Bacillaceae]|uniref:ATP-binding cassette domain-containing protein n=1 Tax=Evansella alkalicola TaxID=745819 RepID=A0ABS6K0B6_9BACI|nr:MULTISPECIES: energy-coupling factor transporter ATPase [Bacillaceae]MBU9723374.1 ATP-binding cassette domain-containing protein [Bacillus alkalicola]